MGVISGGITSKVGCWFLGKGPSQRQPRMRNHQAVVLFLIADHLEVGDAIEFGDVSRYFTCLKDHAPRMVGWAKDDFNAARNAGRGTGLAPREARWGFMI